MNSETFFFEIFDLQVLVFWLLLVAFSAKNLASLGSHSHLGKQDTLSSSAKEKRDKVKYVMTGVDSAIYKNTKIADRRCSFKQKFRDFAIGGEWMWPRLDHPIDDIMRSPSAQRPYIWYNRRRRPYYTIVLLSPQRSNVCLLWPGTLHRGPNQKVNIISYSC